MYFCMLKRLIVLVLLVSVAGCASQSYAPAPKVKEAGNAFERAMSIFHEAVGLGARDAAPKSYQKTMQALVTARAIIKNEPDNKRGIEKSVNAFAYEAEHLLHITGEVNELRSVESVALENVVLSAEYRLLSISDALKQPDPRRQKLYEQSVMIAEAARRIASSSGASSDQKTGAMQHVNKNEQEKARIRVEQLELQLKNSKDKNDQLLDDRKSSQKRIEFLERLVLDLTEKNSKQEETIKQLKEQLN